VFGEVCTITDVASPVSESVAWTADFTNEE
jgi:hypothetical protein